VIEYRWAEGKYDLLSTMADEPTRKHHPVARFVTPDEFKTYETVAYARGFLMVSVSPLTCSSYHASEDFERLRALRGGQLNSSPAMRMHPLGAVQERFVSTR
jgi:hypothetical protein